MGNYGKFLLILFVGEILALGVFYLVRHKLHNQQKGSTWKSVLMGIIERTTLFFGLASGVSQILIMFGTLKIGSMFNDIKSDKKSSDYFLIGNLVSVLIALTYLFLFNKWRT